MINAASTVTQWAVALGLLSAGLANTPASRESAPAAFGLDAEAAYQAKDWPKAAQLYQRLTAIHSESFLSWMRLGVSLHKLGQNPAALQAFGNAQRAGAPASATQYQIALAKASMREQAAALEALAEAIRQGLGRPDLIQTEPEFDTLRPDPRFARLLQDARRNDAPCEYRGESRQFDFWLGDWSVTTTQEGAAVGQSHIEAILGGCGIWENWTSLNTSGFAGKSYNTYNTEARRWEQFWLDNQGGMIHFFGNLQAGYMDFHTAAIAQPDGTTSQRHLRFFKMPMGQVRQLSEASRDGGKTWSVEYDFTYSRAK